MVSGAMIKYGHFFLSFFKVKIQCSKFNYLFSDNNANNIQAEVTVTIFIHNQEYLSSNGNNN